MQIGLLLSLRGEVPDVGDTLYHFAAHEEPKTTTLARRSSSLCMLPDYREDGWGWPAAIVACSTTGRTVTAMGTRSYPVWVLDVVSGGSTICRIMHLSGF